MKQTQPVLHAIDRLEADTFVKWQHGSYLAGLWEGDGHIMLPKQNPGSAKKHNPVLAITFSAINEPLIQKLVESYGGRKRRKQKEGALVYTIGNHESLLNIVSAMNGYLRTPKIYEFNALVDYLNDKLNAGLPRFDQDLHTPLSENYWLAGFMDADGGFKIRYTAKRTDPITGRLQTKERIEVRFFIEQRQFHPKTNTGFESIMRLIADFFGVNLRVSKHGGKSYWVVDVFSVPKLEKLVDYLLKYPLCTAKFNNYEDWLQAFQIVQNKLHLTESGKSEIALLKSRMNKRRVVFDWSHL
jgi:hypothetical protein